MTDWQPHEDLTHGGSSPAEDVEPDDLPVEELRLHPADKLQVLAEAEMANKRVAELEAENERLREQLNSVRCGWPSARMRMRFLEASLKAIAQINKHMQATWGRERCWAAAWKRAASKFRAWQADTDAELELERRAVEVLARRCEQWSPPVGLCDHDTPLHGTCAACWVAWAREQAREEGGE